MSLAGPPQFGGPQYDGGYPVDQPPTYPAAQQQQQQQQPTHYEAPQAAYFDQGLQVPTAEAQLS
jgi:hypothetical protein